MGMFNLGVKTLALFVSSLVFAQLPMFFALILQSHVLYSRLTALKIIRISLDRALILPSDLCSSKILPVVVPLQSLA